jgi:hypothetical protein
MVSFSSVMAVTVPGDAGQTAVTLPITVRPALRFASPLLWSATPGRLARNRLWFSKFRNRVKFQSAEMTLFCCDPHRTRSARAALAFCGQSAWWLQSHENAMHVTILISRLTVRHIWNGACLIKGSEWLERKALRRGEL